MTRLAGVVLLLALVAFPAPGQSVAGAGSDLLRQGERAYVALEYDSAAALLRRGLAAPDLPDSLRRRALAFLGATELFRGRRDSAVAVFAELVRADPGYSPDSLVFPPRVTTLFSEVRRTTILALAPAGLVPPVASAPARADSALPSPLPPAPPPSVAPAGPPERPREPAAPRIVGGLSVSAGTGLAWLTGAGGGGGATWRGPLARGAASLAFGAASLRVALGEGRLSGGAAARPRRDLVEGSVDLGVRPVRWLDLTVGSMVRAYVTDSATARLVAWRVGAHLQGPGLEGRVYSSLDLWSSVATRGNVPGAEGWKGGEAEVMLRVHGPLLLRLGYRVDDVVIGAGKETLAGLSAGVSLPIR